MVENNLEIVSLEKKAMEHYGLKLAKSSDIKAILGIRALNVVYTRGL